MSVRFVRVKLQDVTACGRAIDPRYPTNRALLVLCGFALLGAFGLALAQGHDVLSAVRDGSHAAILVFLAWALGRELAPDDPAAAFIGLGVVVLAWVTGARPDLLAPLALVGLVRMVNRTVGPPAKLTDLVAYAVVGSWIVWRGDWEVGVAGGMALLLDFRLAPRHLWTVPFAAVLAGATVMRWRVERPVFDRPDSAIELVAAGFAIAFALVLVTQPKPTSPHDIQEGTLDLRRVQGGMAVGLVAAAAALGRGEPHLGEAAAIWAAIVGTVLGRPLHFIARRRADARPAPRAPG